MFEVPLFIICSFLCYQAHTTACMPLIEALFIQPDME